MDQLYLEIYDTRSGDVKKTDRGAKGKGNAETRQLFENARQLEVDDDAAEFLLDLTDDDTLYDTICLDSAGFKSLTGSQPEEPDYYVRFDTLYFEMEEETGVAPSAGDVKARMAKQTTS